MTIDDTNRKQTITLGSPDSNHVFDVGFAIENTADISVYDPSNHLMRENVHYTVTLNGLPAATPNVVRVTWIGTAAAGDYTFFRTSSVLQPKQLSSGFSTGDIEEVFDRATLGLQNALQTVNNIYNTNGSRIQVLGNPENASDASTLEYAQSEFSKGGFLPSPVTGIDEAKALYAYSTTSVIWKDPFDVPYPSVTSKILQVNGSGDPAWVNPVEYAPPFPLEPSYLSVDDSVETSWRVARQLPAYENGNNGDSVVAQEGESYAWHPIRWLDAVPQQEKYIWNSTGTGANGAISLVTSTSYSATKGSYIREDQATTNFGTAAGVHLKGKPNYARYPVFEWDLSALTASDYTMDTIISVNLRLKFFAGSGTNRNCIIKRMPYSFVENEITWEQPSDATEWGWVNGGVNDLDHELPVPTISIGGDTDTSDYVRVDVTQLFLDAIYRRSGILRIMFYDYDSAKGDIFGQFWSNTGVDANIIKLEVTNASARRAYWQEWNYSQHRDLSLAFNGDFQYQDPTGSNNLDIHQPHCGLYTHLEAGLPNVKPDVFQWVSGATSAQLYAFVTQPSSASSGGTPYAFTVVTNYNDDNPEKVRCFYDGSGNTGQIGIVGASARVSAIWMANE